MEGHKRYLCRKVTRRAESGDITNKAIFAALPNEAIRLDRVAAERLASVLPETEIEPGTAAARVLERFQRESEINIVKTLAGLSREATA